MRRIRNEQSIAKVKKKREKETTRKVDKPRQTHSIVAEERIVWECLGLFHFSCLFFYILLIFVLVDSAAFFCFIFILFVFVFLLIFFVLALRHHLSLFSSHSPIRLPTLPLAFVSLLSFVSLPLGLHLACKLLLSIYRFLADLINFISTSRYTSKQTLLRQLIFNRIHFFSLQVSSKPFRSEREWRRRVSGWINRFVFD